MKKYSIIDIPLLSFFSKALYRDVCFNWKGAGIGYLFLLVTLCWIPQLFFWQTQINNFVHASAPNAIAQLPEIIFKSGTASTKEQKPFVLTATNSNEPLIVIDTTGATTDIDQTHGALMLITPHALIIKDDNNKTNTFTFKDFKDFTINQTKLTQWVDWLAGYALYVLTPFIIIGSFVRHLLYVLLYGLLGMIFASMFQLKLSYESLLRLSVVALTPSMIVSALMQASQTASGLNTLEAFALTALYLFIGIKFCADKIDTTSTTASTPQ